MQVTIDDKSTVNKNIHVEISSSDVLKELNKAYKELNKTASIKGFRTGKIPRTVLERRFARNVHADISSRLIQDAYAEVVKENQFDVLATPIFTPEKPEILPGKDFVFDIALEVRPKLETIEFKGLELKKNMYQVTDEEINAQLGMIQRNLAVKEPVTEERPVKESDFVLIDYQGFVDGTPFNATPKVENYVMPIGSNMLPEAFSTKLIGAIPRQELEIEVVYPDNGTNTELAGKTVTYKLLLKEIQEQVLPPIDDTLAEKLGNFETLDELKKTITANIQQGINRRIHHELSEQIFTHLLAKNEFEVPNILVEPELDGIVADIEQNFKQKNITLEERGLSPESIREKYKGVAEQQARRHILLAKIIDQEKIGLNDEELEAVWQAMGNAMGETVDAVKALSKKNPQHFENVKYYELENKAAALIIANSKITEVDPEGNELPA